MPQERSREETLALRARLKQEAEAQGLTESFISDLVDTFYDRIRQHPELGPVFASRITDWDPHLAQMKTFWGSIAHHSGAYKGNPMQKHIGIANEVTPEHFKMWLALFEETLKDLSEGPQIPEFFMEKARNIARSLQLGMFDPFARQMREKAVSNG